MVVDLRTPPTEQPQVSRRWLWATIALIVVWAGLGIALAFALGSDDGTAEGPGPQEPAGPQAPVGPQEPVGPEALNTLEGSGVIISEVRPVGPFDELVLSGVASVVVTTDDETFLEIETDNNIMPLIETTVDAGTLTIAVQDEGLTYDPSDDILVRVGTPGLQRIEHTGVGSVTIGELTTGEFEIVLAGVGDVEIGSLLARSLLVDLSGVGSVTLAGTVTNQTVMLGGETDYRAGALQSTTASVEHTGIGSAELWVSQALDVSIANLGSVSYYGTPTLNTEITGLGSVLPLGAK